MKFAKVLLALLSIGLMAIGVVYNFITPFMSLESGLIVGGAVALGFLIAFAISRNREADYVQL